MTKDCALGWGPPAFGAGIPAQECPKAKPSLHLLMVTETTASSFSNIAMLLSPASHWKIISSRQESPSFNVFSQLL